MVVSHAALLQALHEYVGVADATNQSADFTSSSCE